MPTLLTEWWPLILSVIGLIIWITNLRKDTDANARAIAQHEDECERNKAVIKSEFSEIRGSIERQRQEARMDIASVHGKLDELMRLMISRGGHA